jgi:hypothetical protein
MSGTANPRGGKEPYISVEGHTICDIRFYEGLKLFGEDAAVSHDESWLVTLAES